jgi:glycosyltransferase involved in cell wall biosynthesis
MRILYVSHDYPVPAHGGGLLRLYHLARGLARKHEVTLVSVRPSCQEEHPEDPLFDECAESVVFPKTRTGASFTTAAMHWAPMSKRLAVLFSSWQPARVREWHMPELVDLLRSLRQRESFDAVWVSQYLGQSALDAGFNRFVLDLMDIESLTLRTMLHQRGWYGSKLLHYAEFAKAFWYDKRLPNRVWRIAVCKPEDTTFFGNRRNQVYVVPNGVESFAPSPPEHESERDLLFVGTLSYPPNTDGITYFCRSVFPLILRERPRTRLRIVGASPPEEITQLDNGETIEVVGLVPDVTPYFNAAAVVLCPLRIGGGTRLKVLEALARGKAVVSTTIGAEGLDVVSGLHLELADSPAAFAASCVELLDDPARRRQMGAAGREYVLERFHWQRCAEAAEHALGVA